MVIERPVSQQESVWPLARPMNESWPTQTMLPNSPSPYNNINENMNKRDEYIIADKVG
jgi:hypothetical protein